MDEKSSVQEPKSVEKELLLLDLRRIFWLAPLGLLLTFALLATMHFLKRDLTLEGFSLIDFKNPSFEQIWADAVNIVPEDFDPLTWLLTFLTFDVAIVVVIVMDGKSRIKGTIELFPRHPSALPSLYCFSRVCSLPALWIGMVLSSVWSLSCSSRFGHASWRMPVEFLPRKSESHA